MEHRLEAGDDRHAVGSERFVDRSRRAGDDQRDPEFDLPITTRADQPDRKRATRRGLRGGFDKDRERAVFADGARRRAHARGKIVYRDRGGIERTVRDPAKIELRRFSPPDAYTLRTRFDSKRRIGRGRAIAADAAVRIRGARLDATPFEFDRVVGAAHRTSRRCGQSRTDEEDREPVRKVSLRMHLEPRRMGSLPRCSCRLSPHRGPDGIGRDEDRLLRRLPSCFFFARRNSTTSSQSTRSARRRDSEGS